jgi:hypothetical protein
VKRTGTLVVLILLAAACHEPEVQPGGPALLTNPGPETLQELEQTVASAMNSTEVTLAADVFTDNSVLVIQRTMQRSIDRPPELGRDLGRPYRFQLVIDGSQCILVDQQSGKGWPLATVECVKE